MELDELKTAWKNVETPPTKTPEEITMMLRETRHPVLSSIRWQFTFEIIIWSVFLLCYYSMFDGERKPITINLLLISGILLSLIHNVLGYNIIKYIITGVTIRESLENYLVRVKRYAMVSIVSRLLLMVGFVLFFTYEIHFNTIKYSSLGVIIIGFIIQLFLLCRLWARRLKGLKVTVESLAAIN